MPTGELRSRGLVYSYQIDDGPVTLFGVMPEGFSGVEVATATERLASASEGRYFVVDNAGKALKRVTFTGPTQRLQYAANLR